MKMKPARLVALLVVIFTTLQVLAQHDPEQEFQGVQGKTLADSKQWYAPKIKAPAGAPNVVWILLDDVGFGSSSPFGGLIETPTFDSLAKNGLRYTNFHTTAICAPTRAALLTGRNSHSVAMGHHPELGIGEPGYNGDMPFEAGTVAEIMKENGYNTFAVGKWHSTLPSEATPAGPYNRWPTGRGFEHFYGFLGGMTDQWHPLLVEETNPVDIEPNKTHLTELITDKAINYIANQKSAAPDKPFFLYYAPGATHAPHQVYKEWIEKYKGKFDMGWDKYRTEVFKRQQAMGLLPAGTKLPPRQAGIKAWDSLSANEQKVFARFMEVYAGFFSYTDFEIGRLVNYLKEIDQLDNTIIVLMIGDNGASKEGTYGGAAGAGNSIAPDGPLGEGIDFLLSKYDQLGTEYTSPNYPLGWAQAANTPFRYWKSDANSEGGSHNPMILFYPKLIKDKGALRTQYSHVIDILPTTIELTGIHVPNTINGYKQRPIQGTSLAYTISNAKAPTRHTQQYYEIHGGRSVYKDGWKAEVYHPRNIFGNNAGGDINFSAPPFDKDKWELYNLNEDWTETNDLAAKYPAKLEELKKLFDSFAVANNVYPLKNYREGLAEPVIKPKTVLYGGATAKFKVKIGKGATNITSIVAVPKSGAQGVIFSSGGIFGGISLYIKNSQLAFTLSDGKTDTTITTAASFTAGKNEIKLTFTADAPQGRTLTIFINNTITNEVALGAKSKQLNTAYGDGTGGDGISIGKDMNSKVGSVYEGTYPFTGKIYRVTIEQDLK